MEFSFQKVQLRFFYKGNELKSNDQMLVYVWCNLGVFYTLSACVCICVFVRPPSSLCWGRINSCVGQANHRSFLLTLLFFLMTSVYGIRLVLQSVCPQQNVFTALLYCPGVYSQYRYREHLHVVCKNRDEYVTFTSSLSRVPLCWPCSRQITRPNMEFLRYRRLFHCFFTGVIVRGRREL